MRYATLGFEKLHIKCVIGVYPHERKIEQELAVDLKIEVDLSLVAVSKNLSDTVDYDMMAQVCEDMAKKGHYLLIENYALDLADAIFAKFPARSLTLFVRKLKAIEKAECAFIELHFKRS